MDTESQDYIQSTYRTINILNKTEKTTVELVTSLQDNHVYIKKTLRGSVEHYQKLKQLSHPVLPRIYFVSEDEANIYVIEEYIKGDSLSTLLEKKGHFSEKQVLDIALQLCSGLEYLHENKIIHRDIKPSNILLTDDSKVKLIDFDVSRQVDEDKQKDTKQFGTKGYAPPEQYGFAQTDERSDIYALGITAKELLGKDYKGHLLGILDKCTEIDPKYRVQSVKELTRLLNQKPPVNKRKLLIALSAAMFIVAMWFWFVGKEKTQPPVQDIQVAQEQETGLKPEEKAVGTKENSDIQKSNQQKKDDNLNTVAKQDSKSDTTLKTNDVSQKIVMVEEQSQIEDIAPDKKQTVTPQEKIEPVTDNNKKPAPIDEIKQIASGKVKITANNWNTLKKLSMYGEERFNSQDMWMYIKIQNNAATELINPAIEINLYDIAVKSSNQDIDAGWARHTTEMGNFDSQTKLYRKAKVTIYCKVAPKDWIALQFNPEYYLITGPDPRAIVTFRGDNYPATTKEYKINIVK